MAEAATQSEVEDVLTSVRRLVNHADQSPQQAANGAAKSADKLVLTPQLRVQSGSVLHLTPENAVHISSGWPPYESSPLATDETRRSTNKCDGAEGPAPLLLTQPERVGKATRSSDISELKAKIAALETAIARTVDQWEPDDTGSDAYAGTKPPAMTWQESADLDGQGNPLVQDATDRTHATTAPVADEFADEQILDEDALRALVAEVVQAELQGALGDRITRNVRKLVRREIQQALAAQSLT